MPNNFVLVNDYLHILTLRFETTVCNNAKPGKRTVRDAIEKCVTSNRAINCVNAIYGIKSMVHTFETTVCNSAKPC